MWNASFKLTFSGCVVVVIVCHDQAKPSSSQSRFPLSRELNVRIDLKHACSRSDTCSRSYTEACDMCYVFNVNLTDSFDDRRSQCRLIE